MTGRIFRVISAITMLVLYTSVMAASDIVALTCHCNTHSGDVHTAFNHIHKCEKEGCTHHDNHSDEHPDMMQITAHRCCNHNHSNNIVLYTQPRSVDDDHSERQNILLAVVTDVLNYVDAQSAASGSYEYGEYLLPSLGERHTGGGALRAPPALA